MNIKMLKELDFAAIISEAKGQTESGRNMIKNYAGHLFSNEATYGLVNNFVREARNYAYDKGVMETLSEVASFINENKVSWGLASACETVATSRPAYDNISKNAIAQVDHLLETLDENQVVQYIKAGALKNIQYIPEFRQICKGVYSRSVNEVQSPTYSLSMPICFVESIDDTAYFQVAGHNYKNECGAVVECEAPSQKYIRINASVNAMKHVDEALVYEYEERGLTFTITEDEIKVKNNRSGAEETISEAAEFDEWRDIAGRGMYNNGTRARFMNVTEALKEVFENMDSIVECDCGRILRSSNGSVHAIVEGDTNVIVNTIASRNGASYKEYKSIVEALADVEKVSGVNLQTVFEDRIKDEVRQASDAEINESLKALQEQQINERRKRIEQLTEQYKDNPMKLAILNKLANEISKI